MVASMASGDERALLERVANGDRAAMRALYDIHADGVHRFVSSWLADPFDASDIVQETMLEVWRRAGSFAGRSAVKSWIFSIARNKAVDRNRKGGRAVLTDSPPDQIDEAPDPHAALEAVQNAERIRACMDKLSAPHRAAIHLAFFEDLSYAEIAEIEQCAVGTIKTRVHHAKAALMRCLARSG